MPEINGRWKQVATLFEFGESSLHPRIDASINPVDDRIGSRTGIEDINSTEDISLFGEDQFHRVVHNSTGKHMKITAIRARRPNTCAQPLGHQAIPLINFMPLASVTPEKPARGAEKGPMNVGGISGVFEPGSNLLSPIGYSVAIGIFEFPDRGRRSRIQRSIV